MNPGYDFGRRTWAGANVSGKPLDDNNRRFLTLSSIRTLLDLSFQIRSVQITSVSQQTSSRYTKNILKLLLRSPGLGHLFTLRETLQSHFPPSKTPKKKVECPLPPLPQSRKSPPPPPDVCRIISTHSVDDNKPTCVPSRASHPESTVGCRARRKIIEQLYRSMADLYRGLNVKQNEAIY